MSDSDRERWNHRYRESTSSGSLPSSYLTSLDDRLPRTGRAMDIAGGDGGNALWLAARGLDVTLLDISDVALALARERARERGLELTTRSVDLESVPLPPGPWDVIIDFNFLLRSVIRQIPTSLAPGGWFVMAHPTRSNLGHPGPSARFLLDDGELPRLIGDVDKSDLEIIEYLEGWQDNGRYEARLALRRLPIPD